ncbi:MAG: DUF402 domain-containing protein [Pseudonocardia sp.]
MGRGARRGTHPEELLRATEPASPDASGEATYFPPGSTILWRYRHSVAPLRVVEDGPRQLVAWLPGGTPLLRPVLPDGRDVRSVGAHEMFRHGRALRRDVWHGYGNLRIAPRGRPWSVWIFREDSRGYLRWYVNLEAPHRRDELGVLSDDRVVDLVVDPQRRIEWKDLDELEGAVASGRFTRAQADSFVADAHDALREVEVWASPFCDGWERWDPDPAWPRPELPADLVADF